MSFYFSDSLYRLTKKVKDAIKETTASNLPIKDNMVGYIKATIDRMRKKMANIESPEKPTFPDLYQVKDLYFLSVIKKKAISIVITKSKIIFLISNFWKEFTNMIEKNKKIKPIPAPSRVSKNLSLNFR